MKIHQELVVQRYGYFIQTWNTWRRSAGFHIEIDYSTYERYVSRSISLKFLFWQLRIEFYWWV